jgi:hypothetical protein
MNRATNRTPLFLGTEVTTPSSKFERKKAGAAGRFRRFLIISCCLSMASIAHAEDVVTPSPQARPLTAVELYMLYRDKSWAWSEGAGRFDDLSRRFTARTGTGSTAASAQGRWTVTDDGRMCIDAQWHMASGVHANITCFDHRLERGTIYQRKEPSGAWYIFKHAVPAQKDEFAKLTTRNLVSLDLVAASAQIKDQKQLGSDRLPTLQVKGSDNDQQPN